MVLARTVIVKNHDPADDAKPKLRLNGARLLIRAWCLSIILCTSVVYATDSNELDEFTKTSTHIEDKAAFEVNSRCPKSALLETAGWIDRTHANMTRMLCTRINRLDSFFGRVETTPARSFVRIQTGYEWQSLNDITSKLKPAIRARVRLPNASKRFNLLFSDDENDPDTIPNAKSAVNSNGQADNSLLGSLLGIDQSSLLDYDVDIGFKSDDGPRLFSRARVAWQFWPDSKSNLVLSQAIFWLDGLGYGELSRLEYNHALPDGALFRWDTSAEFSEETSGLLIRQDLSLLRQIDHDKGITLGIRMEGNTRPTLSLIEYGAGVIYRQRIFRPWLYYELEPEIFWPLEAARDLSMRFTARLEVQFGDEI